MVPSVEDASLDWPSRGSVPGPIGQRLALQGVVGGSPGQFPPPKMCPPQGRLVELSWGCSPALSVSPSCRPLCPALEVIAALVT